MRKSPDTSAGVMKNLIAFGIDGLWVSKPDKNKVFKWRKLNSKRMLEMSPGKVKYEYESFLKLYKKLKFASTIFDYNEIIYDTLERDIEESERKVADSRNSSVYQDDGNFSRYESKEYLSGVKKDKRVDNAFLLLDMDIERAVRTNGKLFIFGDCAENAKPALTQFLRNKLRAFSPKLRVKGTFGVDIKLNKL